VRRATDNALLSFAKKSKKEDGENAHQSINHEMATRRMVFYDNIVAR
jgi:hypothetical protein